MDLLNRPAAWALRTLQWWCDRFLILPQDAEALAVQLSTGTAVLRDIMLKTDSVNDKLGNFGMELFEGYVSRIELQLEEWSSLKVSINVETVSLSVKRTGRRRQTTAEMPSEENVNSGGVLSSLVPLDVVVNTFLANLKVHVDHIILRFEAGTACMLQCDLHDVSYERMETSDSDSKKRFRLDAGSVAFSFLKESVDPILRFLNAEKLMLVLGNRQDQGPVLDVSAAAINTDLNPEALCEIQNLASHIALWLHDADAQDEDASMAESVFYDAEEESKTSSFYSDASESVFFDCEEGTRRNQDSPNSHSFTFNVSVNQLNNIFQSSSAQSAVQFSLSAGDFNCCGTWGEQPCAEINVGQLSLEDRSLNVEPISVCRSATQIPETFYSSMTSHNDRQMPYFRFGFSQLQRSCLTLKLLTERQKCKVSMQSVPVVFWCSCESIHRCVALLQTLKSFVGSTGQSPSNLSFEFDWDVSGIYGALECPRNEDKELLGILAVELKTGEDTSLISVKECSDSRTMHTFYPSQLNVASISIADINIYHFLCKGRCLMACHSIASCSAQPQSLLSTGKALTIEVTQAVRRRESGSDLSNMAYSLVNSYSQRSSGSFQERTLSRVEYEEKCVHSADLVLEVLFGSIVIDLNVEDVEAIMDTVLQFWHPLQMAEQMKTGQEEQTVTIINGQEIHARFETDVDGQSSYALELHLGEMEVFGVSGLQRKMISTLAITLGNVAVTNAKQNELCRIGVPGGNEGPCVQFFEVSELDYRNARFKQWTALQQKKTILAVDGSVVDMKEMMRSLQKLVIKNEDRIRTDIEVEHDIAFHAEDAQLQYTTSQLEGPSQPAIGLKCNIDVGHLTVENLRKGAVQLYGIDVLCTSDEPPDRRLVRETALECQLLYDSIRGMEIEIRNQQMTAALDPRLLADLIRIASSISSLQQTALGADAMDIDTQPANLMEGIVEDAFSARRPSHSVRRAYSEDLVQHEDEDGFVVVENHSRQRKPDVLKRSSATWLEGASLDMRHDYISLLRQQGTVDDISDGPSQLLSSDLHPVLTVRCPDLSAECSVFGQEPSGHINIVTEGVTVVYTLFGSGSYYRDRLEFSIQEIVADDRRENEDGRRILERNKCQLRTACSRRLKQQKTLSSAMMQMTLETVIPDAPRLSKATEKRFDLRFVPLRLRLSHSLTEFSQTFINAIPSMTSSSSVSGGSYFQKCFVSAFYVIVDYRPRSVDLERLKSGSTSELVNMVQWEGLEFFLNETNMAGIPGWESLFTIIIQNWTHDITHSERHRLVSGIPALGILKRVSPAAQDVVRAAMSKVLRREPAELDVRGVRVRESPSLSRAMGEFGRVLSLEVLNLCAHGTEGIHFVFEGVDSPPAPTTAQAAFQQAGTRLKQAGRSVITEPIQSARSGGGVGVAMTKALWAVPKALLAPASAVTTVIHGTLKSACDALDTENVLNS